MFVKICGITNLEDAQGALEAGADALGFVLSESPRRVDAERAAEIVAALPAGTLTVGVFRNEPPERVAVLVEAGGFAAAQVHSRDPAGDVGFLRPRIPFLIEAVPVTAVGGLARAIRSEADLVLVDSARPGSGLVFDWSALGDLSAGRRIVLAGGLSPENVARAVRRVRPYGVDVSSGVEASPGRKDHGRVRSFVERAHAAASERA